MTVTERALDITLYGATGFTGRLAARYLAEHAGREVRWGIAGRNRDKLLALARELGREVPVVVADSEDPASLDELAAGTRVLASTAGPFARHGTAVVEACLRGGTDYCDISGETRWVRRLLDAHHDEAAGRGVKLVPFCGFDSVPSDLGTLFVVDQLRSLGQATREVRAFYLWRGGLNGGSLATMLHGYEQGNLAELADPILLNPPGHRSEEERRRAHAPHPVRWEESLDSYTAPFIMAPINTRVVRRSAALCADAGEPYGPEFRYSESYEVHLPLPRVKATMAAAGLALLDRAMRLAPVRDLARRLGPRPGEGPSESVMEGGFFRARLLGIGEGGTRVHATFGAEGDPGNRVTVACLCESALALATQRSELPGGDARGGVLTPATALGLVLARRLQQAGMRLAVDPRGWS